MKNILRGKRATKIYTEKSFPFMVNEDLFIFTQCVKQAILSSKVEIEATIFKYFVY
jgi:hypothetical protein